MTDPEMADATYIEPITWQVVEKIIAKERPDAVLPTMGGQTALNCALDLHQHGVLAKYGVEMIGANEHAIEKAEDRLKFKDAMTGIGLHSATQRHRALDGRGARRAEAHRDAIDRRQSGFPMVSGPASRSAARAAASPTTPTSSRRSASAGSTSRRPRNC